MVSYQPWDQTKFDVSVRKLCIFPTYAIEFPPFQIHSPVGLQEIGDNDKPQCKNNYLVLATFLNLEQVCHLYLYMPELFCLINYVQRLGSCWSKCCHIFWNPQKKTMSVCKVMKSLTMEMYVTCTFQYSSLCPCTFLFGFLKQYMTFPVISRYQVNIFSYTGG